MKKQCIPLDHFPHQFSERDIDYTHHPGLFKDYYEYPPEWDSFPEAIEDRLEREYPRETLVDVLLKQYKHLELLNPALKEEISILKEPTSFTVTTAHQPCLFTGPLYVLYKAASCINLARSLGDRYSQYNFFPVFIVGGEDHDFEEMNHAQIFGKEVTWEREETGGPVGRMSTESLEEAMAHLKDILGESPNAQKTYRLVEEAYMEAENFGDATARLLHALFGKYGLLMLQMDDPDLKQTFRPIIERELFAPVSKELVREEQEKLEEDGYSSQAYAREINFFLFNQGQRERIERIDGSTYHLVESDTKLSEESLSEILEDTPERLSPNVILRPLYQEYILPNLAYIGGGGELAYWLERHAQFEQFDIPYPILIRRNSVLWFDKRSSNTLDEAGFTLEEVANDYEPKLKEYAAELTDEETSLSEEKSRVHKIYKSIAEKAKTLEPTLTNSVEAEKTRQMKALDHLEDKLLRVAKQKNEQAIKRVRKAANQLFPDGNLQERTDNFISYYLKYGEDFVDTLVEHLDPMERGLMVLEEQN